MWPLNPPPIEDRNTTFRPPWPPKNTAILKPPMPYTSSTHQVSQSSVDLAEKMGQNQPIAIAHSAGMSLSGDAHHKPNTPVDSTPQANSIHYLQSKNNAQFQNLQSSLSLPEITHTSLPNFGVDHGSHDHGPPQFLPSSSWATQIHQIWSNLRLNMGLMQFKLQTPWVMSQLIKFHPLFVEF